MMNRLLTKQKYATSLVLRMQILWDKCYLLITIFLIFPNGLWLWNKYLPFWV